MVLDEVSYVMCQDWNQDPLTQMRGSRAQQIMYTVVGVEFFREIVDFIEMQPNSFICRC